MASKVKKNSNVKASKKKTNFLPLIAVAAVAICAVVVFLVNGNGSSIKSNETGDVTSGSVADSGASAENGKAERESDGATAIVSGGSLVIPRLSLATGKSVINSSFPL